MWQSKYNYNGDTAFIYLLMDPRPDEKRAYVGWTVKAPSLRLRFHYKDKRERNHTKYDWLRELSEHGLSPLIMILDVCHRENAIELEKKWGKWALDRGYNLVNLSPFGKGYSCQVAKEVREKLSRQMKGRKYTAQHCRNISSAKKGKEFSEQHRANLKIAQNKYFDEHPESKKLRSQNTLAKFKDEGYREKHRQATMEAVTRPEYRQQMSRSLRAAWASGKFADRKPKGNNQNVKSGLESAGIRVVQASED